MKRLVSIFVVLLAFKVSAQTNPDIKLTVKPDKNGRNQFRISAEGICTRGGVSGKPNLFALEYYTPENGDWKRYGSKNDKGNVIWKTNCDVNQQLRQNLMAPGNYIKFHFYEAAFQQWTSKILAVPCQDVRKHRGPARSYEMLYFGQETYTGRDFKETTLQVSRMQYFEEERVRICDGVVVGGSKSGGPKPAPTPVEPMPTPKEPEVQYSSCDLKIREFSTEIDLSRGERRIGISADCDDRGHYNFDSTIEYKRNVFKETGCPTSYRITERNQLLCQLTTSSLKSFRLKVSIKMDELSSLPPNTVAARSEESALFEKEPTFFAAPVVDLSSSTKATPQAQRKALGRGHYWQYDLMFKVDDLDVDDLSSQTLDFEVRKLVDGATNNNQSNPIKSGRARANSRSIKYELYHQFIKPILFGKPKVDNSGGLFAGENKFFVRVYDAYSQGAKREYVDSKIITVDVNY